MEHQYTTVPRTEQRPLDGLAVAGMVLGIVGFFLGWLYLVIPVLGIVLSAVALRRINQGRYTGKGMAVAGLVCSIVSAGIYGLLFLIALTATS